MYVNGEYWGVYDYREKVDDLDFTEHYYDQGYGNVDFLKTWGGTWTDIGDNTTQQEWNNLRDFIVDNDMTDVDNYQYVKSVYNTGSLIDYFILNSYVVCMDWLNWNTAWWRGKNPDGDKKSGVMHCGTWMQLLVIMLIIQGYQILVLALIHVIQNN